MTSISGFGLKFKMATKNGATAGNDTSQLGSWFSFLSCEQKMLSASLSSAVCFAVLHSGVVSQFCQQVLGGIEKQTRVFGAKKISDSEPKSPAENN